MFHEIENDKRNKKWRKEKSTVIVVVHFLCFMLTTNYMVLYYCKNIISFEQPLSYTNTRGPVVEK